MAVTYEDLITPLTLDQVRASLIALLASAYPEVPTTAWSETDEPRAILEFESEILAGLSETVAQIGRLSVLGTATGDALTLHAADAYQLDRRAAVALQGTVTLTDTSGSPQTFAAGALLFGTSSDPDLVYTNAASVTVLALGSAPCALVAEATGSRYNVGGTTLAFATPPVGITLTAASGSSWITTAGADAETDASLRARCVARWGAVAATGTADGYAYWCLQVDGINRVKVTESGTAVTVTVAGPSGAATATALAEAAATVDLHRPLSVTVSVANATPYVWDLRGTVRSRASFAATSVLSAISALLTAWVSGSAIMVGGEELAGLEIGATIYLSQVIEIIHSVAGVVSVTLTDAGGTPLAPGTSDIVLAADQVATLSNLLVVTSI